MERDDEVAVYCFAKESKMLEAAKLLVKEDCSAEFETRKALKHILISSYLFSYFMIPARAAGQAIAQLLPVLRRKIENKGASANTLMSMLLHPYWIVCRKDDWSLLEGMWSILGKGAIRYDCRAIILYGAVVEDQSQIH